MISARSRIAPDDLLTLLTVARLGKYTAAAQVLGVNHTTVSRRIAALEKSVGEPVLASSPDGWEVTQAGEQLISAAEAVETALEVAGKVRGMSGVSGVVRIAAPEGFVDYGGFDRIMALQKAYPDVQIDLVTATQRASKYRSGVDVEIVVGEPSAPHSQLQQMGNYSLGLYVSQDYARERGVPETIEDLSQHRFVFYPGTSGRTRFDCTWLPRELESVWVYSRTSHLKAWCEWSPSFPRPWSTGRSCGMNRRVARWSSRLFVRLRTHVVRKFRRPDESQGVTYGIR